MGDSDLGDVIVWIMIGMAIIAAICLAAMIASVVAAIAGGVGFIWGGGTASVNYYKSFKENMIDSNRAAA